MKCLTCDKREIEHSNTALCVCCDRDEWRDATLRANKRFQYAEDQLRRILSEAGHYLRERYGECPCNYEELYEQFKKINNRLED